MPYRGQQPAAVVQEWTTLSDLDCTAVATTDIKAGETYTDPLGDLWDIADSRTFASGTPANYGFVNGLGLKFEIAASTYGFLRHLRPLSAAAAAVSWSLSADDVVRMAAKFDALPTGGDFTGLYLGLRNSTFTTGLWSMWKWSSGSNVLAYAETGDSVSASAVTSDGSHTGTILGVEVRRGVVRVYRMSTWPTGGNFSAADFQILRAYPTSYVDCILPTDSDCELHFAVEGDITQTRYVERIGSWIRKAD